MSAAQPNAGQRGISPVAGNKKPIVSRKAMGWGVGAVAATVLCITLWKSQHPPEVPTQEKLPAELGVVVGYTPPPMVIPPTRVAVALPPQVAAPAAPIAPPAPQPAPLIMPKTDPVVRMMPAGGGTAAPPPPKPYMLTFADPPAPSGASGKPNGSGQPGGPGVAEKLSGVVYAQSSLDGMKAGLLGDQTFLLPPGILPCIMDTAINSTFEGPVQCHVARDIVQHGVTLLDRGSIIHAWYHNNIQTGQARIFIQANDVVDPVSGCFVQFSNAPVSDTIGQTGVPGNVDNHYLERFGAAMLLTIGQGGESIAQSAMSQGGNTYLSFNGGSGGLDTIANTILQKQINIPPTITVHQGDPIAVFVVKYLDFSPCYDIAIKDPQRASR